MWIEKFSKNSYRSILKWGEADKYHHPSDHLLEFIKETFNYTDRDIQEKQMPGLGEVKDLAKSKLTDKDLKAITDIVGKENLDTGDYDRAKHAFSYTYLDVLTARMEKVPHPPDAVVYPRSEEDVVALVEYCNGKKIPITAVGGRSSVTFGISPKKGGVSLDMTRHLNRVLEVNEKNFTCRVQPGMYGPAYEEHLNNYRSERIKNGFTCGHFPQSFEFSCVGGWVVTRGAGGQSTGYGKIEDMTISMRVVTPKGVLVTKPYPAAAIGPDIDQIILGSEGAFGIVTEVTLKIREYNPDDRHMFSWFFKDWEEGLAAMQEIMQGGFGYPSMLRISDPEETDIALKLQGMENTIVDSILKFLGYKPERRVLLLGASEGDPDHGKLIKKKVRKIARRHGGFGVGPMGVKGYWKRRYSDPYMKDDLMDIGIISDTLETSCTWENIHHVWKEVRDVIKARPKTICMVHASHAYENGANLYFIFLSPIERGRESEDYTAFQHSIIDAIVKSGGSLSHHHGIGKMFAPWYEEHVGPVAFGIIRAVKDHLDPNGIMNPGGTLGLDFEGKKRKP
ncbi:MAG: FAD-binding oxidoreductase [Deltaproteobacteria bacterium]|nr:FAD-binding oxidoreductase [Candidatus Zymogenaceae bacterium]